MANNVVADRERVGVGGLREQPCEGREHLLAFTLVHLQVGHVHAPHHLARLRHRQLSSSRQQRAARYLCLRARTAGTLEGK